MRAWFRGLVFLGMGVLSVPAAAEEIQWHAAPARPAASAAPPPAPAAEKSTSPEQPQAPSATPPVHASSPVALLGRPQPLAGPPGAPAEPGRLDPKITHASFSASASTLSQPVVRGKSDELHQPMPLGPAAPGDSGADFSPSDKKDSSSAKSAPEAAPEEAAPRGGPRPGGPPVGPQIIASSPGDCSGDCSNACPEGCCPPDSCCPTEGNSSCCPCCTCGCQDTWGLDGLWGWHPGCFWVSAEYLLWGTKDDTIPPLVTTGPATPLGIMPFPGSLPGATVLVGPDIDQEEQSGARITAGLWLTEDQCLGVEGSVFFLGQRSVNITNSSAGVPALFRPFNDVTLGVPNAELVAYPGIVAGTVNVHDSTELWGAEANLRTPLVCCPEFRLDLLGGFRFFELKDDLRISEVLTLQTPLDMEPVGTTIALTDEFTTRNQFYGGQVGLDGEYRWRRWFLDLTGKVALGSMHESVGIGGLTTFTPPGVMPVTQTGGLLALPTNIGQYARNRFAVLPEGIVKLGYQLTPHLRIFAGYDFLYVSKVARPGIEIDSTINTTQLPSIRGPGTLVGPARPAFVFRDTDFWAQGLTAGLEFRY